MNKTFTVTLEDIKEGKAFQCRDCPIALAVRREILRDVTITPTSLKIAARPALPLPAIAGQFVVDFDCREQVKPFSFRMEIPDAYLE